MYTRKLNLCTKQLGCVHIFTSSSHSFPSLIKPWTPSDEKPRWQWGNKYTALCRKVYRLRYEKGNRYIFRKITFYFPYYLEDHRITQTINSRLLIVWFDHI